MSDSFHLVICPDMLCTKSVAMSIRFPVHALNFKFGAFDGTPVQSVVV